MTRIVDTSVAVKWVVREVGSENALALVGDDLVAPDLLRAELGNVLWKKVQRGEITAAQAIAGFEEAIDLLAFVPSAGLALPALAMALELGHPVYDCYFIALAEQLDSVLVTADRRLVARLRGTRLASSVESLGES